MSSHSSHQPQEVLLAQFSLYVHKGGLKPDSFHLSDSWQNIQQVKSIGGDNIFLVRLIYHKVVYIITDDLQKNMNSKLLIIAQKKIT